MITRHDLLPDTIHERFQGGGQYTTDGTINGTGTHTPGTRSLNVSHHGAVSEADYPAGPATSSGFVNRRQNNGSAAPAPVAASTALPGSPLRSFRFGGSSASTH